MLKSGLLTLKSKSLSRLKQAISAIAPTTISSLLKPPLRSYKPWSSPHLASANLLEKVENIDLEDIEKINLIEKAVHDGNYYENDFWIIYLI